MNDKARGQIQFRERSLQVKDYSGFRYGKITPSDIDGGFDIGGRIFVFIELKGQGAPFPTGQRRFLENLCMAINETGRYAVAILGVHDTPADKDIMVHECKLEKYYHRGPGWQTPLVDTITIKEFSDDFIDCRRI